MKSETIIEVEKEHTDGLGHLNHTQAVEYLERARDDWYQQADLWDGRPWSDDERLGTIVVNVNINYRLECFLGERLTVETFPVSKGNKSFTLGHRLNKPDGQTAIDGEVTSVIMDMSSRSVIPVPDCLARFLPDR